MRHRDHALRASTLALLLATLSSGCAPTLRLREVVLYQNGIGYFERSGSVDGSFELRLAEHEVDDVMKTLTVVGADGSATLAAVIPNDPPPPQRAMGEDGVEEEPVETRRTSDLEVSVGRGRQDVSVSYAVPTPSWGAVYRVVLPEEGQEALLQAWAVVHNASGEDWEDVSLTLATGSPFSYAVDLRTPRFVPRPDVTGSMVTPAIRGAVGSTQSRGDDDGVGESDLCPTEPEDLDGFQDEDGCPDPDNDQDRILDVDDQCPNDPETYNGTEDEDGCPDRGRVVLEETRLEILSTIVFARGSARITAQAGPLLDAVAATLNGNPEITSVLVEGHGHRGEPRVSSLARRRAEAVRDALTGRGVHAGRLRVVSYGADRPLGDAERDRRVSFQIDGRGTEGAGAGAGAPMARAANRPASPPPSARPPAAPRISVESMSRRPSAVALSADVSDETRYVLNAPVTIPADSSTLVAIVSERVAGSEVLLFRPDSNAPGSASSPFRAARVQNDSGLQLVRGPVALFSRGTFVGEGVLSSLNAGENTFIPFAIDGSTHVTRRVERNREPHRIVSIVRGVMSVTEWDVISTHYEVRAGERVPERLVVHHDAASGYELMDPPRETEVSGNAIIVPIDLTPGGETELAIDERRSRPGRHALLNADTAALGLYFSADHLPAGLRTQLAQVLAPRQALGRLDEELGGIRQQRSIQSRRLSELQRSLTAIERSGSSAAQLRRDLQRRLREATTASEALTVQEAERAARRAEANVRLTELIAAIFYDPEAPPAPDDAREP